MMCKHCLGTLVSAVCIVGALAMADRANADLTELWVAGPTSQSYDAQDGTHLHSLFTGAFGGGDAFTFGPDGNAYVAAANRVYRYDATGTVYLGEFVTEWSGGLHNGGDLRFRPDGSLYVTSRASGQILRYDAQTGDFLDVFIDDGPGTPFEMEFTADGDLFVTEYSANTVNHYDGQTGELLAVLHGGGLLDLAWGMCVGPDGMLYVGGHFSSNVVRIDPAGILPPEEFVTSQSGGLYAPTGLEFGPDGNLYVVDYGFGKVRRYDGMTGEYIDTFVSLAYVPSANFLAFVPEPGSLVLLGASCVVLLRRRR